MARDAARKLFDEVFQATRGKGLNGDSFRTYCDSWLAVRQGEITQSSFLNYRGSVKQFLTHLGAGADEPLNSIVPQQIAAFRDGEAKRASPSRANLGVKVLRMLFNSAERDGLVPRNPARHVKTLSRGRPARLVARSPWLS